MPTRVVTTNEAKSRLSELIREAEAGIEVIVARNGHPVARIVPWHPSRPRREPGAWSGRVIGSDATIAPDEDVIAVFSGSAVDDAP